MIFEVIIPKTGLNVEDCRFLEWFVAEGSEVVVGQPLFRMETDKVDMDVEADEAGFLNRLAEPDVDYPVGAVIGHIASTLEEYRSLF